MLSRNPVLLLPAAQRLMALPLDQRQALAALFTDIRHTANQKAEQSWKKRKGPMACYWRAVSTYARHIAHVLTRPTPEKFTVAPTTANTTREAA